MTINLNPTQATSSQVSATAVMQQVLRVLNGRGRNIEYTFEFIPPFNTTARYQSGKWRQAFNTWSSPGRLVQIKFEAGKGTPLCTLQAAKSRHDPSKEALLVINPDLRVQEHLIVPSDIRKDLARTRGPQRHLVSSEEEMVELTKSLLGLIKEPT